MKVITMILIFIIVSFFFSSHFIEAAGIVGFFFLCLFASCLLRLLCSSCLGDGGKDDVTITETAEEQETGAGFVVPPLFIFFHTYVCICVPYYIV